MNTVRAMKSPRACIPLSPNTIRQTKGSRVRSPAGSQRSGGDYDGKVSGRPRSARLERANDPRRLGDRRKVGGQAATAIGGCGSNSSHTLISYAVFCLRDESVTGV